MTAQEFVAYMPPDALAATMRHIYDNMNPADTAMRVLSICWSKLVELVGDTEAEEMVNFIDLGEVTT